jgi:peptide/nickel transport system permease protein
MATLTQPQISRSPGYYIRKRFLQNGAAMLGLTLVGLAFLIAFAGYLILPDATPNANNGIVALQKKPAGFTVKLLNLPKTDAEEEVSFLEKWLFGAPAKYESIPIESVQMQGDFLVAKPYRSGTSDDTLLYKFPLSRFFSKAEISSDKNALQHKIETEPTG